LVSKCADDLLYDPAGGLGLFNFGIIDMHFSQRGRQGRLARLALQTGIDFAFGVDETTGLVINELANGDVNFEVVGEFGVSFFDYRNVKLSTSSSFEAENIKWSYFTQGDKFTLTADGELINISAFNKVAVQERNIAAKSTTDIFSSPDRDSGRENELEFLVIGTSLVGSTDLSTTGETYETGPVYKVVFTKAVNTKALKGLDVYGEERY
jgi:cyanophycinase